MGRRGKKLNVSPCTSPIPVIPSAPASLLSSPPMHYSDGMHTPSQQFPPKHIVTLYYPHRPKWKPSTCLLNTRTALSQFQASSTTNPSPLLPFRCPPVSPSSKHPPARPSSSLLSFLCLLPTVPNFHLAMIPFNFPLHYGYSNSAGSGTNNSKKPSPTSGSGHQDKAKFLLLYTGVITSHIHYQFFLAAAKIKLFKLFVMCFDIRTYKSIKRRETDIVSRADNLPPFKQTSHFSAHISAHNSSIGITLICT